MKNSNWQVGWRRFAVRGMALAISVSCAWSVRAAGPKVSVIGDSYSTFKGTMPTGYLAWYDGTKNGVTSVENTYWKQVINRLGGTLEVNNAWSGSCLTLPRVSGTVSMIEDSRLANLGDPDLILICAGTNDSWLWRTIGDPVYHDALSDYTSVEKQQVSGALCYLLKWIAINKPNAEVMVISNSYDDFDPTAYHGRPGVREEICLKQKEIAEHYGAMHVQCHDIEKESLHPTAVGHAAMYDQIMDVYIKTHPDVPASAYPIVTILPTDAGVTSAKFRVTVKEIGAGAASATVTYQLSKNGGAYSAATTLTTSATNNWSETIVFSELDTSTKYTLRVTATNNKGKVTTVESPFATVAYEDDFIASSVGANCLKVDVKGEYRVYTFTNTSPEQVFMRRDLQLTRMLVVGGGGSGGWTIGGGGGGGAVKDLASNDLPDNGEVMLGESLSICVGAGGNDPWPNSAAHDSTKYSGTNARRGLNGGDSTVAFPSSEVITALGGGGGGAMQAQNGLSGGNGGGGGAGGSSVSGEGGEGLDGNAGGAGKYTTAKTMAAGGGGGAGGIGGSASDGQSGAGGAAKEIDILGDTGYYGGGGGGGGAAAGISAKHGDGAINAGNGSDDSSRDNRAGMDGKDGFGGGGGGGGRYLVTLSSGKRTDNTRGGNGGCGTVILVLRIPVVTVQGTDSAGNPINVNIDKKWANDYGISSERASDPTTTGANGWPLWQNYALGLDPTDTNAMPVVAAVQTSDASVLTLSVVGIEPHEERAGVDIKYQRWMKDGASAYAKDGSETADTTFEVPLSGISGVKYFKVEPRFYGK